MSSVQLRAVTLGQGGPKVIVPLTGPTVEDLLAEAAALATAEFDIVEPQPCARRDWAPWSST